MLSHFAATHLTLTMKKRARLICQCSLCECSVHYHQFQNAIVYVTRHPCPPFFFFFFFLQQDFRLDWSCPASIMCKKQNKKKTIIACQEKLCSDNFTNRGGCELHWLYRKTVAHYYHQFKKKIYHYCFKVVIY